jgi:hypothetical protein
MMAWRVSNQQERRQEATIHHLLVNKNVSVGLEIPRGCCQRIAPPWKGLGKKEVLENYEKRMKEMEVTTETIPTATCSAEPTEDIIQPTSKYLAPKHKLLMQQQIWFVTLYHM